MFSPRKIAVVGIDPGQSGGLAMIVLGPAGDPEEVHVTLMPTKPGAKGEEVDAAKIVTFIEDTDPEVWVAAAAVEIVHSMPKQGVASSFKFGKNYGKALAAVEICEISLIEVTPQKWKGVILDGLGREKTDSIRFVMNRFPSVDLRAGPRSRAAHDGLAEAVCLAEYARLVHLGVPLQGRKAAPASVAASRGDVKKYVGTVYSAELAEGGQSWHLEYVSPRNERKVQLNLDADTKQEAVEEAAHHLDVTCDCIRVIERAPAELPPLDDPEPAPPKQAKGATPRRRRKEAAKTFIDKTELM